MDGLFCRRGVGVAGCIQRAADTTAIAVVLQEGAKRREL
jgi:L-lactate utilization protein LutB